jgi:hypothetical protein
LRNKIFGGIALLLGGAAIVRNLTEQAPPVASNVVADWAMPVLFVILGIYLLTKPSTRPMPH